MSAYTISKLGRLFGLARSTLLYYHRVGLLSPSGRTEKGYRIYSDGDRERLARICAFRQAGLSLVEIGSMLDSGDAPSVTLLENRFRQIGDQILELRKQQRVIARMLRQMVASGHPAIVDKDLWVSMLRAAGLDEAAMGRWHCEFEQRAPDAHHEFLVSLGLPCEEIRRIREWAGGNDAARGDAAKGDAAKGRNGEAAN